VTFSPPLIGRVDELLLFLMRLALSLLNSNRLSKDLMSSDML